jgi:hypothetical protein
VGPSNCVRKRCALLACCCGGCWKSLTMIDSYEMSLCIGTYTRGLKRLASFSTTEFISLLLNNEEIRDVIDTVTSKVVLILGSFTAEKKAVLDAIRENLRHRGYVPVMFDFEKPASKDATGTVET